MPPPISSTIRRALRDRFDARPSSGAAAVEYASILRGEKDFVIYYRLLPWDQLPGALAVVEAGGAAVHLDGRSYTARSSDQVTILAASPELAEMVRGWING
jgi:fructose-1,6-bisphosphatase/inositol monophosphatase family enzyme